MKLGKRARKAAATSQGAAHIDHETVTKARRSTNTADKKSAIAGGASLQSVATGVGTTFAVTLFTAMAAQQFRKSAPSCSQAVRALVNVSYNQLSPPPPPILDSMPFRPQEWEEAKQWCRQTY